MPTPELNVNRFSLVMISRRVWYSIMLIKSRKSQKHKLKRRSSESKTELISVVRLIMPHPPIARPKEDVAVTKVLLAI